MIGIDEAGKGPVLGSMFICGIKSDNIPNNLKDSKKLSNSKIEEVYHNIKSKKPEIIIIEVEPQDIDEGNINKIIEKSHALLIDSLTNKDEKVYCDSILDNEEKYKTQLKNQTNMSSRKIIAENKADEKYNIVSSASIIAKYYREKHIKRIKSEYDKEIGSGYPSDNKTRKFLEEYYQKNKEMPSETRLSWKTSKDIIDNNKQKDFSSF